LKAAARPWPGPRSAPGLVNAPVRRPAATLDAGGDRTALKASAGTQWGPQVAELDGAIDGFQTTISGVDGDSLLGDLPSIVSDLKRIDTAWTALEGQINQACG
jgi:hypothetical protein